MDKSADYSTERYSIADQDDDGDSDVTPTSSPKNDDSESTKRHDSARQLLKQAH
jgi:hypothetical protein